MTTIEDGVAAVNKDKVREILNTSLKIYRVLFTNCLAKTGD